MGFFLARARAVKPDFEGDEAVAEICRRLDELPLALELAAARVKALSATQILDRLEQRLPLLTRGARDTPERQRTLRATIEWSYELLAPKEQDLFRCSSVFAGGFTLDAAEDVAEADVDTLQSLVDKSLLRHSGERYSMLETIREYGRELLAHSDELELRRDGHLSFFVALAVEAEPNLAGRDQQSWFGRLALEQDNVRDALTYACDIGDGERALMLAGSIWRFWWTRGQLDEAAHWYERAFGAGGAMSEAARARGMFGMAHVSEARGDVERTRLEFEEAAELLRRIGEKRWLVLALTHLAGAYEEVVDRESAERLQLEALEISEEAGDRRGAAIVKGNLARLLIADGQDQRASRLLQEALEAHRVLGDAYGTAACLATLAKLALRDGDFETAAADVGQSLELSNSIGDTLSLSSTLSLASAVVLARGDAHAAARLCAADESLLKASGIALDVFESGLLEATMRSTQEALGDGSRTHGPQVASSMSSPRSSSHSKHLAIRDLPSPVTFLLTDVEGPTRLLHEAAARLNRLEAGFGLAGVDPLLEAAADLLTAGKQVVAGAPGRQLHDPYRLVPVAMTAGVRGRFVERPESFTTSSQPRHSGPLPNRTPSGNPHTDTRAAVCGGNVPRAHHQGLQDQGLQLRPEATKYRYAARTCASTDGPWPKSRRSLEPIWNRPRY